MSKIKITKTERELLQKHSKNINLKLVRDKSLSVMMSEKGLSANDISDVIFRSPRSVRRWLKDWSKQRMSSIFTGHAKNDNASKLTIDQREEIQQALQSSPSDFGLPKEFWDVPQLKEYLSANFDIVYESEKSYYFLLQFSNLSFKYPDTFDRKRDEAFIAKRMKEIHKEIKPLLKDNSWEVFASDEVRIEQEAEIRRAWLQKGERTIIKVSRNKESQSYIGFLNQKDFNCELFELSWQKSSEVIKAFGVFLKAHPDKHIAIIWDNASFHKSKEIRTALSKDNRLERVHLIPMPPYAPDHNPIEHVWNTTKQHIANIQHDTFEQTKTTFSEFINNRKFSYAI